MDVFQDDKETGDHMWEITIEIKDNDASTDNKDIDEFTGEKNVHLIGEDVDSDNNTNEDSDESDEESYENFMIAINNLDDLAESTEDKKSAKITEEDVGSIVFESLLLILKSLFGLF